VGVRYHIQPLNLDEVKHYIEHRIKIAGGPSRLKFTEAALDAIFRISKGTPRLINILCEHALLAGFVNETYSISDDIIASAAKEALGGEPL
jgi:general secretion pathway protein A